MYTPRFNRPLRLICCSSLLLGACQAEMPGPASQNGQISPLRQAATPQASSVPALLNTVASSSPSPAASSLFTPNPSPSPAASSPPADQTPQGPVTQVAPATHVRQTAAVEIPMQSLRVPRGFDYAMTRQLALQVQVRNPNGGAYGQVPVSIFGDADHSRLLAIGMTDRQGRFETLLQLPLTQTDLNVSVSALGIDNRRSVRLQGQALRLDFGPVAQQTGQ